MSSWNSARKILCIRLDTIGDVIMTTPAIRALKTSAPDRQIDLMTSTAGAVVAPLISELDHVIIYDAPWLKATPLRANSAPDLAMIEQLQQAQYDAAVIFTVYSQNPLPAALLCYLAEIPLRLAHCHENPYQLLTDWIKDPEPQLLRHEVERQLDLVSQVGSQVTDSRLKLTVEPDATQQVKVKLEQAGIRLDQPWVIIHPGATAASRRYPPEQFASVGRRLVQEFDMQVVFTGVADEQPLIESIRSQMQTSAVSLAGQLDINELAALIALAPLLIANNTGPGHIAAAVGTPVVSLYALTNPQHTPWQVPQQVLFHDVPCRYCYKSVCPEVHHNCLRLVKPEQVVEAVLKLHISFCSPKYPLLVNSVI